MVKPAAKRRVVQFWIKTGLLSERHGCRLMGVSRSTVRYQSYGRDDAHLRDRLKELAEKYPRYEYPTLHTMLRTEGLVENHKRTYRIYADDSGIRKTVEWYLNNHEWCNSVKKLNQKKWALNQMAI